MKILERHPELLPLMNGVGEYKFAECYTLVNPDGAMAEEDIAAALIRTDGHVADAAKILRRSRASVNNAILRNQDLMDLKNELFETALDDIEAGYLSDARAGDGTARKFFLTMRAKDRGYAPRSEVTGKDGGPIETEEVSPVEAARRAAFAMRMALENPNDGDGNDEST